MTWIAPEVERPEMENHSVAGERAMLEGWLAWHRATLLRKCAGLSGERLAECAVPPSNLSLLGLVRHMGDVERSWFRKRFAAEPVADLYYTEQWPDADFEDLDPKRAEEDYARLIEECRLADAAAAGRSLDDTFTHRDEEISLRWVYTHMIEEYARHNGHADLLRERLDGVTGE